MGIKLGCSNEAKVCCPYNIFPDGDVIYLRLIFDNYMDTFCDHETPMALIKKCLRASLGSVLEHQLGMQQHM